MSELTAVATESTLIERSLRLARLYGLLRAASARIIRAGDRAQLLSDTCNIAVDQGGFLLAWIGVFDAAKRLQVVATAGIDDGYAQHVRVDLNDPDCAAGPIIRAYRARRPVVSQDIANDPVMLPWRERALERGYRSVVALPLVVRGEIAGMFQLYASEPHFFDDDEIDLVTQLASDAAFAWDAIESRSARMRAEEASAQIASTYRAVVEHASDGIFVADASGYYLDVNPAGLRMLGYEPREIVGQHLSWLIHRDDAEIPLQTALAELRPGVSARRHRMLRKRDGSALMVEISASVLPDGRLIGFTRDVTEQRKIESQLIATERLASIGTLAAGVAHEINNPLAAAMLQLDQIDDTALRTDGAHALELVRATREALERVAAIVRDLKTFWRAEDESLGEVDVHAAIESATHLAANEIRHRAELQRDYGPVPRVRANAARLGQVLLNLLMNAAQAMPDRSSPSSHRITVRTRAVGPHDVAIEVIDNGSGIAQADRLRIFDPFFTTKPQGLGTGLGLPICAEIVKSFGGRIEVDSEVGRGSTFRVILRAETKPGQRSGSISQQLRAVTAKPKGRVLIIDDEPSIVNAMRRILSGYEVFVAQTGRLALEMLAAETFDCVLCDLMMPEMTGMDLYESIAATRPEMAPRFVFMTGGAFTQRARAFLDSVANRVLAKPFGAKDLRSLVEEQVAQRA